MVEVKNFCFSNDGKETLLHFGVVIFWCSGKNRFMKNKKWIIFPESPIVNLNPKQNIRNGCLRERLAY